MSGSCPPTDDSPALMLDQIGHCTKPTCSDRAACLRGHRRGSVESLRLHGLAAGRAVLSVPIVAATQHMGGARQPGKGLWLP